MQCRFCRSGSSGSASEIFDTTIAPLYDFMGGAIEGEGTHLHDFLEGEIQAQREEGEDDTDVCPSLDIRLVHHRYGVGHVGRHQEARHDVTQHQGLLEPLEDEGNNAITITLSTLGNVGPTLGLEIGPTMSWSILPTRLLYG